MLVKHRGLKISAFGALLMVGLVVFQGVSSAHHPEIEASAVCVPVSTARITVTTTAWDTTEVEHRVNNDIEVTIAGKSLHGAFNDANDYTFSVTVDVPADGATYTARATAIAQWGPDATFGSAGEFRETDVTVPNSCPGENTTTTTVPPTTAPSTTAPTTTVATQPTATIGVQVQGISETRTQVLAFTGVNVTPLIVIGADLMLIGAAIELTARRRHA